MRSGEEIQAALRAFVARWDGYSGTEKAGAQTFLTELLACFGTDGHNAGVEFEKHIPAAGFADLYWAGWCVVEMKRPEEAGRLEHHYGQARRYWQFSADAATSTEAVRYVVVCAFSRIDVWEPGRYPLEPRASFDLAELPERYDALAFLAGQSVEATFAEHHRQLTREAAKTVALLYEQLADRSAAPADELQRFAMQSVWAMFGEDHGMLDNFAFQNLVTALEQDPGRSSAAELGHFFRLLNQKTDKNRKGPFAGTTYVNGELFADPAEVDLTVEELGLLRKACEYDWRQVDPTIFGSLMEGVLGRSRRWALGAHYTHEVDIMKIVVPTIVRPWRERIEDCSSVDEARALLDTLCAFKVLDPACGCGNFLYIAYRELRLLEKDLKARIRELSTSTGNPLPPQPWSFYRLDNLHGIDIEQVAVVIARVTLWMGHRQMIESCGPAEDPLPLVGLSTVRRGDALRDPWPETDCIVGNPPFLGDRLIRGQYGADYVAWLKKAFSAGVVDYSAYWFRRAAEHLQPGLRAGLVSTNTLRENKHRAASLGYVLSLGGVITDAVSSQKWPGDAKVHVSITNWVARPPSPPERFTLDGLPVAGITTQLRSGEQRPDPVPLAANRNRSFIGCQPTAKGFILTPERASALRADGADPGVLRPFFTTEDLVDQAGQDPSRWIIDFGTMPLEEAKHHPALLDIVRQDVKPGREGASRHFARLWWQFAWPRPEMRKAIASQDRYLVSTLTGKRLLTTWADAAWCPSNAVGVFAFDDDYSMGVLTARVHEAWAWARSSTFETRLRYTPSSVFETFPWPTGHSAQVRDTVATASRRLLARRSEICLQEQIGLTTLYNAVDEGAWTDLAALHRELDEAVAACYGWPATVAQDDAELVRRLLALNVEIAAGVKVYDPFP